MLTKLYEMYQQYIHSSIHIMSSKKNMRKCTWK
jgi:hypothetical protein